MKEDDLIFEDMLLRNKVININALNNSASLQELLQAI